MHLNQNDIKQLNRKGLSKENIEEQLGIFKKGIPYVKLLKAATINEGIDVISKEEATQLVHNYEQANIKVVKFTPASGAATRMFKLMHQFMEQVDSQESFDFLLAKDKYKSLHTFAKQLTKLGFYPIIETFFAEKEITIKHLNYKERAYLAFKAMLDPNQLGFSDLPKGLVTFHKYENTLETAFGEHFYEGLAYATKENELHLHFTISEEHQAKFSKAKETILTTLKSSFDINCVVHFSYQEASTDTVAVDLNNHLFRLPDGSLCFRPSGHGALIENLNKVDADVIFIKNIDNIPHQKVMAKNAFHKKVLAGYLLYLQERIFHFLNTLTSESNNEKVFEEAVHFAKTKLHLQQEITSEKELINLLNRPIRVCGMVKNEGAPGGGPFWMENANGNPSLQIVEKSQIDINDNEQNCILENSSHFNPVDLVCGVRNYLGEKFDLTQFVNHERGFITHKTVGPKEIKALEKPGLWNGAMELWNTVFVEVPSTTFNPVKAVMDLLQPAHTGEL